MPEEIINIFLVSAVVALIISLSAFFLFQSMHKTARTKHFAGNFIKQGSLRFTLRKDSFVSSNTSRTRRK